MRKNTLTALFILGCALLLLAPGLTPAQFGGGGKKKGGGNPGGFGGGDANSMFDYYAKGQPVVVIANTNFFRRPLTQFAEEKGITNGQLTRPQFAEFWDWQAKNRAQGGGMLGGGGKGSKGDPAGGGPSIDFGGGGKKKFDFGGMGGMQIVPSGPVNVNLLNELADAQFRKLDADGDGKLNQNEMPGPLRFGLSKWDKSGDGLIDMYEFREYFSARMVGSGEDQGTRGIASIIIEIEELDRKPVVYRPGGATPAGLPAWFKELDTDKDGQVALYEWRKGASILEKNTVDPDLDEFTKWDLNNDGYISPDEALRYLALTATPRPATSLSANGSGSSDRPSGGKGAWGGKGGGKGKKGERPPQ